MLVGLVSWSLGLLDYVAVALLRMILPKRAKFFGKGYGDLSLAWKAQEELLAAKSPQMEKLEFHETKKSGPVTIQRVTFTSPLAKYLPEAAQQANFYLVEPVGKKAKIMVILLPATGEAGKSTRLTMAKHFAQKHGWSSAIVTAPFYASRKPKGQPSYFIETVESMLTQSNAVSAEASLMIEYYMKQSYQIVVSGFSWGAAMSCVSTGLALARGVDGSKIACVPYVGSASPCAIADGALQKSIHYDSVDDKLFEVLYKMQLSCVDVSKAKPLAVLNVVGTRDDHFLRHKFVQEWFDQLGAWKVQNRTMSWQIGGHATAMAVRPYVQPRMIERAVQLLEKSQ